MKTALGLMSGTSVDGIDAALLHTDGEGRVEFGPHGFLAYDEGVRQLIFQAMEEARAMQQRYHRFGVLSEAESAVTLWHQKAVDGFLKKNAFTPEQIDVIGFHGQTVLHRPDVAMTVQLGDGKKLAQASGIDVIYDLRAKDMEQGGQGAPLVPVFHQALAHHLGFGGQPVAFVNIGGISNITYHDQDNLIAFDTGPGNVLIDQWMTRKAGLLMDQQGQCALKGKVVDRVVEGYLNHSYFAQGVPKSLDRYDFPALVDDSISLADGARSLAYVTAFGLYCATQHLPHRPRQWVLCGGGRYNQAIVEELRHLIANDTDCDSDCGQKASVVLAEDVGLNGDMLEAQAFAYLAVRSMKNKLLTFPTTTGCHQAVQGGVWARGHLS